MNHSVFTGNAMNQVVSIDRVANLLGISSATVRNWVKCGHLKSATNLGKYSFQLAEVENIKKRISNGDLEKLNKRANKSKAEKTFIPDEYINDPLNYFQIESIISFIKEAGIDISTALFLLAINVLNKEQIISSVDQENLENINTLKFSNRQLELELTDWLKSIPLRKVGNDFNFLLTCDIPKQQDFLGTIYQSLLIEGHKSKNGSYYTPKQIVDSIVDNYVAYNSKVLDPCCGTGQFLLSFARKIDDPTKIFGVDIDPIAIRIARINLLLIYKNRYFSPNIVCKNTLLEIGKYDLFSLDDENIKDFDVIATNPPWGLHFLREDAERLKTDYKEITSLESFSYFLSKSIDLLGENGVLSFILPESILNVGAHRDIRNSLLEKTKVLKITYLDRVFKNVFTPVIQLDVQKTRFLDIAKVEIVKGENKYYAPQGRWSKNEMNIFDIHIDDRDAEIMDKVYKKTHKTLKDGADWALGVVTGDNKTYLLKENGEKCEPIYKGKDVKPFVLSKADNYILFTPEKFQQVAPIERYRAKEKLIYKFISKNLVFAYDDQQNLTLNSANILIPKIPGYPLKVIAALFNSSLYQFIFQKKFSTIKVLRGHLEQLPLPILEQSTFQVITNMVDDIIFNEASSKKLDQYIMDLFDLSTEEKNYILNFIQ